MYLSARSQIESILEEVFDDVDGAGDLPVEVALVLEKEGGDVGDHVLVAQTPPVRSLSHFSLKTTSLTHNLTY